MKKMKWFLVLSLITLLVSCGEHKPIYKTQDLSSIKSKVNDYVINPDIGHIAGNHESSSNIQKKANLDNFDDFLLPDSLQEMQNASYFLSNKIQSILKNALVAIPEENRWIVMDQDSNWDSRFEPNVHYVKVDTLVKNQTTYYSISTITSPSTGEVTYDTIYIRLIEREGSNEPIVDFYGTINPNYKTRFYYIPGEYIYIDMFNNYDESLVTNFVCRRDINTNEFYATSGLREEHIDKPYALTTATYGDGNGTFIDRYYSTKSGKVVNSVYRNGKKVFFDDSESLFGDTYFSLDLTNLSVEDDNAGIKKVTDSEKGEMYQDVAKPTNVTSHPQAFATDSENLVLSCSTFSVDLKTLGYGMVILSEYNKFLENESNNIALFESNWDFIKTYYTKYFAGNQDENFGEFYEDIKGKAYLDGHQENPCNSKSLIEGLTKEECHFLYITYGKLIEEGYDKPINFKGFEVSYYCNYNTQEIADGVRPAYSPDYQFSYQNMYNGYDTKDIDKNVVYCAVTEEGKYIDFATGDKVLTYGGENGYALEDVESTVKFTVDGIVESIANEGKLTSGRYDIRSYYFDSVNGKDLDSNSIVLAPVGFGSGMFVYFTYENQGEYYNVKLHQRNEYSLDFDESAYIIVEKISN